MKVLISTYQNGQLTNSKQNGEIDHKKVQFVLGFGTKDLLVDNAFYNGLYQQYPEAAIVLVSTAGEIYDEKVSDNSVSVTAVEFDKTIVKTTSVNIEDYNNNSYEAGLALVKQLNIADDLCYIMILSDGGKVNGSELVNGINAFIQNKVPVTGGLAGDGTKFYSTLVGLNKVPIQGEIVAVAFYSRHLKVAHGSMGGWEMFGPERMVTSSKANELFQINHQNALEVYKKYLGPYADDLPGSALLFPLSVKFSATADPVVRTILSINHQTNSMVFAGDVPTGSLVRFMKSNFDKLIDAASEAAKQTLNNQLETDPALALLISCVGRKIVLDTRIEEEVEAVHQVFGQNTLLTGFYSYGEISPFSANTKCELHNQTMTITTFNEI